MEEGYLIKFKRPGNDYYEYKCKPYGFTPSIKDAFIYSPNSPEMHGSYFYIRWAHPDWNPEIVDYRNEIGTYISTYNPKLTFKKILVNTGIILAIPFIIPLVALITVKDKIIELYNKKKNISTDNKPMGILPL